MINWEPVKAQLENILNAPFYYEKIDAEEWKSLSSASAERDRKLYFFLYKEGNVIGTLSVEEVFLTASERRLVEMTIAAYHSHDKKTAAAVRSDEESRALAIWNWLHEQLENGVTNKEMPEIFASQSSLYNAKIPLLLYGDYSDNRKVTYTGLKKLLESFFDAEMILIPLLEKEWLILGSQSLLTANDEDKEEQSEESLEETLASICYGLYEMMVSEWVGECHLSIHYPIIPAKSLLSTVIQLRETVSLGKKFQVGSNIHLPWHLHLHKLLNYIPEQEKLQFIEHVLKHIDYFLDTEMLQTLEHFFELNCNVSETAKKLYIHRNTLLYRLDRFKQETDLDVRLFNHAVLVKIALQLYKVTKRK